jgi:hypothetical protein
MLVVHGVEPPDPPVMALPRGRIDLLETQNVTRLGWGEQFHAPIFVSREGLRLIEAGGGGR